MRLSFAVLGTGPADAAADFCSDQSRIHCHSCAVPRSSGAVAWLGDQVDVVLQHLTDDGFSGLDACTYHASSCVSVSGVDTSLDDVGDHGITAVHEEQPPLPREGHVPQHTASVVLPALPHLGSTNPILGAVSGSKIFWKMLGRRAERATTWCLGTVFRIPLALLLGMRMGPTIPVLTLLAVFHRCLFFTWREANAASVTCVASFDSRCSRTESYNTWLLHRGPLDQCDVFGGDT